MKIAFIFTNFPSPGDTFTTNRITQLIDLEHEVTIFALSSAKEHKIHENVIKYQLIEKTIYFKKTCGILKRIFEVFIKILLEPIRSAKIIIKISHLLNTKNLQIVIRSLLKYELIKKSGKYDIIFFQNGLIAKDYIFLKHFFEKTKFVANFLGYDFSGFIRKINNTNIYKVLFDNIDLVICHSEYSKDILIDLGCKSDKLVKIPVGVDTSFFNKEKIYFTKKNIDFVIVSRLVEKKGHRNLIDAFNLLAKQYDFIYLKIIGDGPLEKDIKKYALRNNYAAERISFLGFKTQNEIVNELIKADIFVHPSKTTMLIADQEDTTTTLIEAQILGLPVIGTYHAGLPEVVKDNVTGFLVQERNIEKLADAMRKFIIDPKLIAKMGICGKEYASLAFDMIKLGKELENELLKLVSKSKE